MQDYPVAFAGHSVRIRHGDGAAAFLDLLFAGVRGTVDEGRPPAGILEIVSADAPGRFALIEHGRCCATGSLGVSIAAALFDRVIFRLLDRNRDGVALHAAAVSRGCQAILLPGESGAGKSTLTAWLTSRGFSCLTDELVFVTVSEPRRVDFFSRPLQIKPGAIAAVKRLFAGGDAAIGVLEDGHGMIVPPRAINPAPRPSEAPPTVLLFPAFRPGAGSRLEKLTRAQAGASLMACNVNGRNLPDHGFKLLVELARSAPGFRLVYGGFDGLDDILAPLFAEDPGQP